LDHDKEEDIHWFEKELKTWVTGIFSSILEREWEVGKDLCSGGRKFKNKLIR
jgi:hypothetical protein